MYCAGENISPHTVIPNEHTHKIVIRRENPLTLSFRTIIHTKFSFEERIPSHCHSEPSPVKQDECEESFSRIEQGKIFPVGRNDKREKLEMT